MQENVILEVLAVAEGALTEVTLEAPYVPLHVNSVLAFHVRLEVTLITPVHAHNNRYSLHDQTFAGLELEKEIHTIRNSGKIMT